MREMSCGHGIAVPGNLHHPPPSSPSLASRKTRGALTGGRSPPVTWVQGPQQGSLSPPSDATDVECPCPVLGDLTGVLGAVLGATGFLHWRGRSQREIWLGETCSGFPSPVSLVPGASLSLSLAQALRQGAR